MSIKCFFGFHKWSIIKISYYRQWSLALKSVENWLPCTRVLYKCDCCPEIKSKDFEGHTLTIEDLREKLPETGKAWYIRRCGNAKFCQYKKLKNGSYIVKEYSILNEWTEVSEDGDTKIIFNNGTQYPK